MVIIMHKIIENEPDGIVFDYRNEQYKYSFQYNAVGLSSIQTDDPPSPLHGIMLEYKNGEIISALAEYITIYLDNGSSEDIFLLDKYVSQCERRSVDSVFTSYHRCDGKVIAYMKRTVDKSDILYKVEYSLVDGANMESFVNILKSFQIMGR
jgi:hypothetical protein